MLTVLRLESGVRVRLPDGPIQQNQGLKVC